MPVQATLKTAHAKRYLGQFCKHFAHKLAAAWAEDYTTGSVIFGAGICKLTADDEALYLDLSTPDLQDVVERHLVRFGFREEIMLDWKAAAPAN